MSNIDELYAGNIRPLETFSANKEYFEAQVKRNRYFDEIKEELPKSKKSLLEELWNASADMEYEFGKEMFKKGFYLALGFTFDMYK